MAPWLLFVGVWLSSLRRMADRSHGSIERFLNGGDKPLLRPVTVPRVTFTDVAGADGAKEELQEVVEFLRNPGHYLSLGARVPKGVLLIGPPGTGKTLLARALAGEAGIPFFAISGSCFVEMFAGLGAARVRALFDSAKRNAPCIVFIDEIDAVGVRRGTGFGAGYDEREQTLNQLLVEMDGFETTRGLVVVAATNRPDVLDPALLRPGRFERHVTLDLPDQRERLAILEVHAQEKPLASDVDLGVVARETPGLAGADLENILNEAAILAARRNKTVIGMAELDEAVERRLVGIGGKRLARLEDRRRVAYHEAGHALAAHLTPGADPVRKVSILARGRAGGFTLSMPDDERAVLTRSHLRARLVQLMGGRAAEAIVFGEASTGCVEDLRRATEIARAMVTRLGMSERVGPMTTDDRYESHPLGLPLARIPLPSEMMQAAIDGEVATLLREAYTAAVSLLQEHRETLDRVAEALLREEKLDRESFLRVVQGRKPGDDRAVRQTAFAGQPEPAGRPWSCLGPSLRGSS